VQVNHAFENLVVCFLESANLSVTVMPSALVSWSTHLDLFSSDVLLRNYLPYSLVLSMLVTVVLFCSFSFNCNLQIVYGCHCYIHYYCIWVQNILHV